MAFLTLAVFLQVILRYVARSGIEGLDEAPRYLFVWLVMLGAAAAMYWGEHTALDFFRGRMSSRGRALTKILTKGVGILLFLSMIKASLVLVPNSQLQSSPGLGLPLGYVYAATPVGAAWAVATLPLRRSSPRSTPSSFPRASSACCQTRSSSSQRRSSSWPAIS